MRKVSYFRCFNLYILAKIFCLISWGIIDEDKKRAYAVGADGFLSKPVNYEKLFELINRKLR